MSAPSAVAGVKYDAGKPRPSLLPWPALTEVMAVLAFGAAKYEVDNWQRVPGARERYFDAALRHLVAWHSGEALDAESGRSHLAHAACCVLFLLWFEVTATPWPSKGTTEPTRTEPTRAAPPPPATSFSKATSLEALDAAQRRRLRWRFEHRVGRFASVPEGVTWADATASGSSWLSLFETDATGTPDRDASKGRRDATGTPRRDAGTPHRDAPLSPSHSPILPGKTEEGSAARARSKDDRDATGTPDRDASKGRRDATGTLRSLFERLTPQHLAPDGDEAIRRQTEERIEDAGLGTPEGLDSIASALRDPSKVWPDWRAVASRRRRVTLVMLAGDPDPATGARYYTPLAELLAFAETSLRKAQARAATEARPVVAVPAPEVASTVDYFKGRRAAARPVAMREASNG